MYLDNARVAFMSNIIPRSTSFSDNFDLPVIFKKIRNYKKKHIAPIKKVSLFYGDWCKSCSYPAI